ncbi:sugar transferase [Sulfuriferula thiophila]|uniref:sugar transferase n=1 Tax=Sulfuriferula thiophila TaxID=1781211 RepID=UPI000F6150CF|nr:sugar transferase [Sulfuriferula thiophila]
MYIKLFKPLLDKIGALVLLTLLLPVIMLTALAIFMTMGRPVVFRQLRPGLHGQIFPIYKFRTMTDERNVNGALLPDDMRLKGVGKLIRSLSLDELPQLINVLKGDMSFIGPRPLLVEYLPLYSATQYRRHEVKPGISGWAQINGRNALSWDEKFKLDVWYVDHLSFALDMRIAWMTVLRVIRPQGVSQSGHVTMPKFTGKQTNDDEPA